MELKGLISVNGTCSFTCCDSKPKVLIGLTELHDSLLTFSQLESPPGEDEKREVPTWEWQVRYVTRPTPFLPTESFDDVCARAQLLLTSEHVGGCYSDWTCGVGDYDFTLNGGHSLLDELASHAGEYVWLRLGEPIEQPEPPPATMTTNLRLI